MLQVLSISLNALLADRKGVTALEYGILAAAIIGAVAASVGLLGSDISDVFSTLASELTPKT